MMPVSSGCPPSIPCPRGLMRAGCSSAPLGWRPPSASAASHTPEMSRFGAGPDFLPAYHGLIGGMLFHFASGFSSGLDWVAGALTEADWQRSAGEKLSQANSATAAMIE